MHGFTGITCETPKPNTAKLIKKAYSTTDGPYNCEDRNPCTVENSNAGRYYFTADDADKFIQCSEWGECSVLSCPPELVWNAASLTCDTREPNY
jgi:hypothetical protein